MPPTKISQLRDMMDAGEWRKAISMAAKFPRLGAHRAAILDAQLAYTNPRFARQIGKDPEALIAAGQAALRAAYARP
jgi:hypothetical protein